MSDRIIYLNLGGVKLTVSESTLYQIPYFQVLLSGHFHLVQDRDNDVFIDRDGEVFKDILKYVRSGYMKKHENEDYYEYLHSEAVFYNLEALEEACILQIEQCQAQKEHKQRSRREQINQYEASQNFLREQQKQILTLLRQSSKYEDESIGQHKDTTNIHINDDDYGYYHTHNTINTNPTINNTSPNTNSTSPNTNNIIPQDGSPSSSFLSTSLQSLVFELDDNF